MDLGRFVRGQSVKLGIATVDGSGNAVTPDAAPVATVSGPAPTIALKLAMNGGSTAFSLLVFLGSDFPLGTYTVTYAYSANGFDGSGSDAFELIQGGDPGGDVISMAAYARPEAQYVVCQLSSGRLVQGRNPRL